MPKTQPKATAQIPLILRFHRLMDAFAKSDDERDFYLDRNEGFILYIDLEKSENELERALGALAESPERFCLIPKLTFYEVKKIMDGFVNEKVYDIDTKEKLLDIIAGKDARENFLEFIYDNLTELEKWQQYYQERFRVRIIEWLRSHEVRFVFEEDLDVGKVLVESVKTTLFDTKVSKDIQAVRDIIEKKAETYYSIEALNPRPKRGRPPKQVVKVEIEPQFSDDIYLQVPATVRPFVYIPDITSAASVTFSARFETEEQFLANLKTTGVQAQVSDKFRRLTSRLDSLKMLSDRLMVLQSEGTVGDLLSEGEKAAFNLQADTLPTESGERVRGIAKGVLPQKQKEGISEVADDGLFSSSRSARRKKKS